MYNHPPEWMEHAWSGAACGWADYTGHQRVKPVCVHDRQETGGIMQSEIMPISPAPSRLFRYSGGVAVIRETLT